MLLHVSGSLLVCECVCRYQALHATWCDGMLVQAAPNLSFKMPFPLPHLVAGGRCTPQASTAITTTPTGTCIDTQPNGV